jgi:hypothetical protein
MTKTIAWGGIDPGLSGCACLLTSNKINFYDFESEVKAANKIDEWHHSFDAKFLVEQQFDVRKPGFNVSGKLLVNYGFWRGVLIGLNCKFIIRAPKTWQTIMPGKPKKTEDPKARALKWARKYYPAAGDMLSLKKHHNRADALLMAHYLRQVEMGQHDPV